MAVPKYPILFYKPATALTGPTSPIPVPLVAQEAPGLDYECELVIVIGRRARDVAPADAPRHVLGYAVGNDVSHRAWQLERGGGMPISPSPPHRCLLPLPARPVLLRRPDELTKR